MTESVGGWRQQCAKDRLSETRSAWWPSTASGFLPPKSCKVIEHKFIRKKFASQQKVKTESVGTWKVVCFCPNISKGRWEREKWRRLRNEPVDNRKVHHSSRGKGAEERWVTCVLSQSWWMTQPGTDAQSSARPGSGSALGSNPLNAAPSKPWETPVSVSNESKRWEINTDTPPPTNTLSWNNWSEMYHAPYWVVSFSVNHATGIFITPELLNTGDFRWHLSLNCLFLLALMCSSSIF